VRVSREKFAENRGKIIDAAGILFRENGFDGVTVADIMKQAGFTHGGFYGHFQSKEDLQLEVSRTLVTKVEARWKTIIETATGDPLDALLDHYLSWCMVESPGTSCIFVALMEEVSRSSGAVREVFNDGFSALVDLLANIVPGETMEERRKNGFTTLSSMMGALSLARSVGDRELAAQFLSTMREKLSPGKKALV
jgi:TetR/AcrR family transcriptional regulator, transcriptional repressor for nem operon